MVLRKNKLKKKKEFAALWDRSDGTLNVRVTKKKLEKLLYQAEDENVDVIFIVFRENRDSSNRKSPDYISTWDDIGAE